MSILTIRPVTSAADELRFIKAQWLFYEGNLHWVPPLIMDRKKLIDRRKNPFYKHARMELFLAEREGKVVGRIGAIVNDNHNREHNENIGFFGFFECVNEQPVADALFDAAAAWLKTQAVTAMRGPASPSVNDEYGLLVEGFDRPPMVLMPYNPPYYAGLIEGYGLQKVKDLYAYEVSSKTVFTDKLKRVAKIVRDREGLVVRTLDMKNFKNEVRTIRDLYSRGWERNWGEVPMTEDEFNYAAGDLKAIVDPDIVIIAEVKGKPVGFGMTLPDINQVLIKNRKGWLIPGAHPPAVEPEKDQRGADRDPGRDSRVPELRHRGAALLRNRRAMRRERLSRRRSELGPGRQRDDEPGRTTDERCAYETISPVPESVSLIDLPSRGSRFPCPSRKPTRSG